MVKETARSDSRNLGPGEKVNDFENKEKADIEFTKDPSITHNGVKFALGNDGEFNGNPYKAACKIRTKNVVFQKEYGNYKVSIPYNTMLAIYSFIREKKENFNKHVEEERKRELAFPLVE